VFVCTAILSCTSELIYFRLLRHNADDVLIFLPGCRTIRRRAARRRASQLQLPPAGSVCCGVSFLPTATAIYIVVTVLTAVKR
jgi:hypothetical protein